MQENVIFIYEYPPKGVVPGSDRFDICMRYLV